MSDDSVLRNRTESTICQLRPSFQDSTASKVEYFVQRYARLVERSWKPVTSFSRGTVNSSAPSYT
jgi:hypothetical protein